MIISGFIVMLVFRVLVGIGEAGCTPPANSLIADYYPPKRRSTALGYYAMGVTVGTLSANLIGGPVAEIFRNFWFNSELTVQGLDATFTYAQCVKANLPNLTEVQTQVCHHGESMGWRSAFVLIGGIGVVLAIVFQLTVKEPPRGYSDPPGSSKPGRATFMEALKELGYEAEPTG